MNRLFINNKEVHLSDQTKIGVTYQANNIAEIEMRQGNFTNIFKIPVNDHNNVILEWAALMSSDTDLPYRRLLATYEEDGVELVSEGDASVVKVQNGFYFVKVVSGNVSLKKALGDVTVGELYTDSDNFVWSLTNAENSRDGSQHYIFPLIDWRTDIDTFFNSPTADVRQMLPCITAPGFFSRMADYTGFSFGGSYLSSSDHTNMVITPSEFEREPDSLEALETKAEKPSSFNGDPYCWNGQLGEFVPNEFNPTAGSTPTDHVFTVNPVYETNTGEFSSGSYFPTVNHVGKLTLSGTVQVNWDRVQVLALNIKRKFDYLVRIKKGATVIAESFHTTDKTKLNSEEVFPVVLTTGFITLEAGEEYKVEIEFRVQRRNVDTRFKVCPAEDTTLSFIHTPTENLSLGDTIKPSDLFRMKARDLLTDIMNKRGLLMQTNDYTKVVSFNFFQDIIDNKAIARKWNSKVGKRGNSLSFKFGNYAQQNWFRFKEDEDVTSELGDYFFNITNENLEEEKDVVRFKHSATEQNSKYQGVNIPEIEAIDSGNAWQKPTYRVLQLDIQDTDFNVTFTDGVTNNNHTTNIPVCKFVGMDELAPIHYEALVEMLDRAKVEVLPINLIPIDIHELDHIIPIYLSLPDRDIEGYFYLNIIDKYRGGETNCQLIRL